MTCTDVLHYLQDVVPAIDAVVQSIATVMSFVATSRVRLQIFPVFGSLGDRSSLITRSGSGNRGKTCKCSHS